MHSNRSSSEPRAERGRRRYPGRGLAALLLLLLPAAVSNVYAQGYGGTVEDILARGDIFLLQDKPREAIVQFQEVRTLCPTLPQMVESLRGEARARIAMGAPLQAAGLFEEAATIFENDPRVPDLLYAAGSASHRGGDTARAIGLLQRALDAGPTPDLVPRIKFRLSQALRLRGQNARAIELLVDFEERYPNHALLPTILYTLAIAHHDVGDLATSESNYRKLIETFPGTQASTEAHLELAQVLAESGRALEAAQFYRLYVDLSPGSPYAAKAYELAGDMLLFRSPKESAQLYALARIKEKINPQPRTDTMKIGGWIDLKSTLAGLLARTWLVVVLGAIVLAGLAWGARTLAGLFRRRGVPNATPRITRTGS